MYCKTSLISLITADSGKWRRKFYIKNMTSESRIDIEYIYLFLYFTEEESDNCIFIDGGSRVTKKTT